MTTQISKKVAGVTLCAALALTAAPMAITEAGAQAQSDIYAIRDGSFTPHDAVEISPQLVSQLLTEDGVTTADLTIHKRKGVEVDQNQFGRQLQDAPGEALPGVVFDAWSIDGIDLTTIEGWRKYERLADLDPTALVTAIAHNDTTVLGEDVLKLMTELNVDFTRVGSVRTDASGEAKFNDLPTGAYLVAENIEASETAGLVGSAPFITALPFTNQDGKSWNRDVHVYPKNQILGSNKTVTDQNKHASDTIHYTLSGDVPPVSSRSETGRYFDGYSLRDTFETAKWTPDTGSVSAKIAAEGGDDVALADGDFQVSEVVKREDRDGYSTFTISLTRSGLDKLEGVLRGKGVNYGDVKVVADVDGTLAQDLKPGDVVNRLDVLPPNIGTPNWDRSNKPDDPNDPPTPPTPETEVVSKYAQLNLIKTSTQNQEERLQGATFQLHKCVDGPKDGAAGELLAENNGPITVGGQSSWTTDKNGTLSITGIQVEDWYNGASQKDVFTYCLVETAAPENYELLPEPVAVSLTAGRIEAPVELTVQNVPTTTSTFRLPVTGEMGRWYLVIGGAITALLAAAFVTRQARREEV